MAKKSNIFKRLKKAITLKKVVKGVGKVATGALAAIPVVGTVIGAAQGAITAGKEQATQQATVAEQTFEQAQTQAQLAGAGNVVATSATAGMDKKTMLILAGVGVVLLLVLMRRR